MVFKKVTNSLFVDSATEKSYSDLAASAERRGRSYAALGGNLGDIRREAELYVRWLDDTNSSLTATLDMGPEPKDVDTHLTETQVKHAYLLDQ